MSADAVSSRLRGSARRPPRQTDAGAPALGKTHAAYVLSSFIRDVKAGTLPQVSWIVAPAGYSEHPSFTPDFGAHYVNTVLQTLFSNPGLWRNTALLVTYDEHDGFFDHQLPPFPEATVTDEFIGGLPIGPGTRVPMIICSPWTRGGYVDSNVCDHTSVLRFLATWAGVKPANVTSWRASVTGDLTAAFDFRYPDFSIPRNIPTLDQTWALTQLTGGSTKPPAEGAQKMPVQERSYVWDATLTAGKYAFSVYGPDGFLTSFAGTVVPAGQDHGPVPAVTATLRTRTVELTLANEGQLRVTSP